MCGIVGYIGNNAEKVLLEKLKLLEYRGYDSAGIAIGCAGRISVFKAKGEINNLVKVVGNDRFAEIGIGHTRWATHGKPEETNAHPHVSEDGVWNVVHNGIIENYIDIRDKLIEKGYAFYSETDTETIPKLLQYYSEKNKNELSVLSETLSVLTGSYALAILNKNRSGIYFARNKSPLFIAKNGEKIMIASDVICFKGFAEEYYPVNDGVFGYADKTGVKFYDRFGEINVKAVRAELGEYDGSLKYKHFMLKEIYETKTAVKNLIEYYSAKPLLGFLSDINGRKIDNIKLIGCGTAYHACLLGAKMIEESSEIECSAFVASEFRYSQPKINENTVIVLVSQSGETADTLACLELAKQKGAYTVAVVNVEYSSLAKNADCYLPIKAGVEVAVASTKAFCAQIITLEILSEILAEKSGKKNADLLAVKTLYDRFDYGNPNDYKLLADALRYNDRLFMIGRGADYTVALEASLKIKETSYINSDTYYAGELKHGFLALIEEDTYVIVFATQKHVLSKTLANAEEARARGAKIILFTCFDLDESLTENFFYVIKVADAGNCLQSVLSIVPWQMIAYYTSVNKGLNPDKPRNLAKSVTVE